LDLDLKKIQTTFAKKWIWVENLIQLFGSKMDVDWIIKNIIHAHPYFDTHYICLTTPFKGKLIIKRVNFCCTYTKIFAYESIITHYVF